MVWESAAPVLVKIGEGARCRLPTLHPGYSLNSFTEAIFNVRPYLLIFGSRTVVGSNSSVQELFLVMGEAYQIKDQEMPYFLTFQVVGWADVFSRKLSRDFILENLTYCRNEKGLYLFGYVMMTNHIHLVVQQKDGNLSGWIRDFKKFTSKKLLKMVLENPQESRKEWLEMIFAYNAKFNKISGEMQFWTHEIEPDEIGS